MNSQWDAFEAPAAAVEEPAEAEEPAASSADDSDDAFAEPGIAEPGTPPVPPPRKTAQELAAALEAVSDQLEPAAAPEPKSGGWGRRSELGAGAPKSVRPAAFPPFPSLS